MATSTLTSQLASNVAVSFARRLTSRNNVFLAISNQTSPSVADTAVDSSSDIQKVTDLLIGGVKITDQDLSVSSKRVDWVSGNVIERYSAFQPTNCIISVYDGSKIRVYKCLNNNNNSPSTVQPSGTLSKTFTTSDQYVWKYMWEVPAASMRFASATTIPVIQANTSVAKLTVDTITIDDNGRGYSNYYDGIIQTNDIDSPTTIRLPAQGSSVSSFYNQCVIEITNPSSSSYGEVRTITGYNGATKTITLSSKFTNIQVNDTYSIRPQVFVSGSSNTAVVSAVVNSAANTISRVIVHSPGSGYSNPSANVYAHSSVGIQRQASVTPHVSPIAGHGGDLLNEVQANIVTIQKTIANTTSFTSNVASFAQVSVLANPLFNNVVISGTAGKTSTFIPTEKIIGYRPIGQTVGNAVANTTVLVGTNTVFTTSLRPQDKIVVANTSSIGFATVVGVANDSVATITCDYPIAGNTFIVTVADFGSVQSVNSSAVVLTNVPAGLQNQVQYISGKTSRSYDVAKTITYPQTEQVLTSNTAVKNSGHVLYINNNLPINISANKTIAVKLSITF